MENAGLVGLSRQIALQRELDVVANNIANLNTTGYKADNVTFGEYMMPVARANNFRGNDRVVSFTQDRTTWLDQSQGPVEQTGNPLDIAMSGNTYLTVQTPQGERYTRAGRFSLSAAGQIVDMSGNPVLGTDGRPLSVPPDAGNLTVGGDGTVSSDAGPVGKLRVVQFDDQQSMHAEGASLFETSQPSRPVASPAITQGAVEGANISAIAEVTAMMGEMREFEFASQFADGEAQREQSAIDRIGRQRGA